MTDRPLRVAHLADTHLGYSALTRLNPASGHNQRAVDIERAFAAAIDDILDWHPDLVLHAGDAFHHSRPPMQTIIFFVQQLRRLEKAGIPAVVIGGNHDTPRLRTAGSVLDLCAIACPGVHFVHGYDWERVRFTLVGDKAVSVIALPHGAFTNDQPPAPPPPNGDANETEILMIHGQYNLSDRKELRGAKDNVDSTLVDAAYAYVALGHWHTFDKMGGNAWYSGSTERIGLTDKDCIPGYARVVLHPDGPEVTHVPLPARPLVKLPDIHAEGMEADEIVTRVGRALAMKDVVALRAEAMVVSRVYDTPVGVDREASRLLRAHEAVRDCWAFLPQITAVRAAGQIIAGASSIGPLGEEFDAFITRREEEKVYTPTDATIFRAKGQTFLTEALQTAEQRILPPITDGMDGADGEGTSDTSDSSESSDLLSGVAIGGAA